MKPPAQVNEGNDNHQCPLMRNNFGGSSAAVVFGCLTLAGGITQISTGGKTNLDVAGLIVVFGALSYRSLKRRRLGIKPDTRTRQTLEFIALFGPLILLSNSFLEHVNTDPVPNLLIPILVLIPYLIVFFMRPVSTTQKPEGEGPEKGMIYTESELKQFRKRGYLG